MTRKPRYVTEGFCPNCKRRVIGKWEDFGIGNYEFWGAKGVHHDYIAVCTECGESLSDVEEID